MILLDQTGSQTYPTSRTNDTPRHVTLGEPVRGVVERLAQVDRESGAGQEEEGGGGVYVVGFAGGQAYDHGDVNVENFTQWWNGLTWDGSTLIMPGYAMLIRHFNKEFANDQGAVLFLLYIGDGGGRDFRQFEREVTANPRVYVAAAIIGDDNDALRALSDFRNLENTNPRVRAFDFTQAMAEQVAAGLLEMIG